MPGDLTLDTDKPKLTELLTEIGSDLQTMVEKQIQMARAEMASEVSKAKQILVLAVVGSVLAMFAFAFGLLTFAHALREWAPQLPLWSVYGIVTLVTTACGVIVLLVVRHRASTLRVTPDRTLETLKESISWTRS